MEKIYPSDHPNLLNVYTHLAQILFLQEKYDEAIVNTEKALKAIVNLYEEDHPDVKTTKEELEYLKKLSKDSR